MKNKLAAYSFFTKSVWFALAIMLVVFCGPVKKLIETRYASKTLTTLPPSADNYKLKTFYREKHEVASFIQDSVHASPSVGLTIYLAAAFFLSVLLLKGNPIPELPAYAANDLSALPLYLRIRKLQV